MSTDNPSQPDPPHRKVRFLSFPDWNSWDSAFWRCVFAFIGGLFLAGLGVEKQNATSWLRTRSSSDIGRWMTASSLLPSGDNQNLDSPPISPAEKRRRIKEEFARYLQGMSWTWNGELKPGTP